MAKIKFGTALACEYVAEGSNRKQTLVNVYAGDILVPHFPINLAIAFYVEIGPDDNLPPEFEITIKNGRKTILSAEVRFQINRGYPTMLSFPQTVLRLDAATTIKLIASSKGFSDTVLVTKRVFLQADFNPATTSGEQPSGQSPPDAPASS